MNVTKIILLSAVMLSAVSSSAQAIQEVAPGVHTRDSLTMVVESQAREEREQESREEFDVEARYQKIWKKRATYINVSYVKQSLTHEGTDVDLKSDFALSLLRGHTYYLHKKSLLNMLMFGIDLNYCDINFAKYDCSNLMYGYDESDDMGGVIMDGDEEEDGSNDLYEAEVGVAVGPSLTVNPVDELKIGAYFHVTPSVAMLYSGDAFSVKYGTFFSVGGAVSWKVISLGMEWRWGTVKFDDVFDDSEDDEYYDGMTQTSEESVSNKWKVGSLRFYLGFRF